MERYNRICNANTKIKNSNLCVAYYLNDNQPNLIYDFISFSLSIIKEYLTPTDIESSYRMAEKRNNSTTSEYRILNPFPELTDVIEQFERENLNIEDLNESNLIYELTRIAFYSNKVTKMICLPEKNSIFKQFGNDFIALIKRKVENESEFDQDEIQRFGIDTVLFEEYCNKYKEIYNIRNTITDSDRDIIRNNKQKMDQYHKRITNGEREAEEAFELESDEFKKAYEKYKQTDIAERQLSKKTITFFKEKFASYYERICNGDFIAEKELESESDEFKESYKKYEKIMQAENMNYHIKSMSLHKLFELLVKDNYSNFKDWGFYRDDNGKLVFALDYPGEKTGTFQFHLENDGDKVVNFEEDKLAYEFIQADITKITKKQIVFLGQIDLSNAMETAIDALSREEEKYRVRIAKGFQQSSQTPKEDYSKRYISKYDSDMLDLLQNYLSLDNQEHIIAVQHGNNLDINASIYALQKYALEKCGLKSVVEVGSVDELEQLKLNGLDSNALYIVRISAGQTLENAINIDTGKLKGIIVKNSDDSQSIQINADEKLGEKSACSILARLGIYVPSAIIKNADKIYENEILSAESGLILARELKGDILFDFAESQRDGISLLEHNLNPTELRKFGLEEAYKKRKQEIQKGCTAIQKYGVELPNGNRVVIVPEFISNGSYYAYALGYDTYISLNRHPSGKGCTFAITANPNKNQGILDENLLTLGSLYRKVYGEGVFVGANKNLIVAGGPKNIDFSLYHAYNSKHAQVLLLENIRAALGIKISKNNCIYKVFDTIASQCIKYPSHIKKFFSHSFNTKTGKIEKEGDGRD